MVFLCGMCEKIVCMLFCLFLLNVVCVFVVVVCYLSFIWVVLELYVMYSVISC